LKDNLSTYTIKESDVRSPFVVESGTKELDNLLGGFKAGEIVFIDGNSDLISNMPNQICVNTYRVLRSDIVYVDGGMCANPYQIAKYARKMEMDQREILEHVHISRAFTVFQMTTILQDMLEQIIRRHNPRTLIIGKFPALYLDSDVSSKESQTLLKNNLKKVRELTTKYDLITILSNLDRRMLSNSRNVRKTLYERVDEIVRMKQMGQCINVDLVKKHESTIILAFAKGQLRLEDFGMMI